MVVKADPDGTDDEVLSAKAGLLAFQITVLPIELSCSGQGASHLMGENYESKSSKL